MKMTTLDRLMKVHFEFAHTVRKHVFTAPSKKTVNLHHLHALICIQDTEGISMKHFAEKMQISSSSATSLIDRLYKAKLVERKRDTQNRKVVRLRLTPQAQKSLHGMMHDKQELFRSVFERIPVSDQKELIRILQSLLDSYSTHHGS